VNEFKEMEDEENKAKAAIKVLEDNI